MNFFYFLLIISTIKSKLLKKSKFIKKLITLGDQKNNIKNKKIKFKFILKLFFFNFKITNKQLKMKKKYK